MAKSRQTFSKTEKEKKRVQKRQDKEHKKEERKSASSKGKSIEEMMAYVDENGNITSTPPNPTRKSRPVEQEQIQISIPKQAPVDPADAIRTGTVTFFNESKGYGFIKDLQTQESIFVHLKGLLTPIKEKDKVSFEVEPSPRGLNAVNVKLT